MNNLTIDIQNTTLLVKQLYTAYNTNLNRLTTPGYEATLSTHVEAVSSLNISKEDQARLALLLRTTDNSLAHSRKLAKELLILADYKFIKKQASRLNFLGEPEDIEQYAVEGALRSLERFNPQAENSSLLSYMSKTISNHVKRSVRENELMITLPEAQHDLYLAVMREKNAAESLGEAFDPTNWLLSQGATSSSAEAIVRYMNHAYGAGSINDEEFIETGGVVDKDPFEGDGAEYLMEIIQEVITDRFQYTVLCMHYGLDGYEPTTIKRIAELLGETNGPNRASKALQSARDQLEDAFVMSDLAMELL